MKILWTNTAVGEVFIPPASTDPEVHPYLLGIWQAGMGMIRRIDVDALPTDGEEGSNEAR